MHDETIRDDMESIDKTVINKSPIRQSIETALLFIFIFSVIFLVERFVMQPVEVDGSSMEPTLNNKNHLLLEKVTYTFSDPERYDVIVFQPYEEEEDLYYIKRIIGLPGERIYIKDNLIYINEEPLAENYGYESTIEDPGIAQYEINLGVDEYFVMGDNRNRSKDSRDAMVGVVKRDSIIGRAWCRIWPLNKITMINHQ